MSKFILIIVLIVILFSGFYFLNTKNSTTPAKTPIAPTAVVKQEPTKDQIIQALVEKNNWDKSNIELSISKTEGNFAKGSVRFKDEMGGGLWFAAKVNGTWKIVYDGNGIITCDELTNYQSFPKDLIPSCYDKESDKLLTR